MSMTKRTAQDTEAEQAFSRLYAIVRTVRGERGCPWDKDQTPLSLRHFLIEEAFETVDAMTDGDAGHVREELGDVFFNVVLIAYLYEQSGDFTLAQSLRDIGDKLIRRHPHVFLRDDAEPLDAGAMTNEAIQKQWDDIKATLEHRKSDSVLADVPEGFPPLLRAYKLLKKAAKNGYAPRTAAEARARLDEALRGISDSAAEREAARQSVTDEPFTVSGGTPALNAAQLQLESAVGDALFALADYARLLGIDPSVALDRTNRAFCERVTRAEKASSCNDG